LEIRGGAAGWDYTFIKKLIYLTKPSFPKSFVGNLMKLSRFLPKDFGNDGN